MMPEMDGYEVCRQLQANERTRRIPVIFVTAKSEVEDEAQGFGLGAVDYITKPVSPAIVLARVRTQLALKESHRKAGGSFAEACPVSFAPSLPIDFRGPAGRADRLQPQETHRVFLRYRRLRQQD